MKPQTCVRSVRYFQRWRGWCLLGILLSFMAMCAAAQAALPKDANGWSILTPSADTRLIYVSSVSGNDSTGTYYLPNNPLIGADPTNPTGAIMPYATYAAAWAQVRNGYADWVLCKRGETWNCTVTCGGTYGRSDTERIVITSYGPSTVRPLFKTGMGSGIGNTNHGVENFAIVGLHFYCDGHDPSSPTFAGYINGPDGIGVIVNGTSYFFFNALFEDCQVEWYGGDFDLQSTALGGAHDIQVRRNVINNSWMTSTSHSQGMFVYHLSNLLVEENVFDHNGWYGFAGSGQGDATMFNHNVYMSAPHDVTVTGNMFLRASSLGTKWTNYNGEQAYNIVETNNLFVEGEVGITLAGNDGGGKLYGTANVTASNNVMEGIGRTQPTGRGLSWGMDILDIDGGLIQNNLVIRQDNTALTNTYGIHLEDTTNRNLNISNNTFYQLLSTSPIIELSDRYRYTGISLTGNIVDTNTYTSPVAQQTSSTFAGYTLSSNHYYSGAAAGSWFQIAGVNKSFAQWQAAAGESGSTTGHTTFADPTRTVETYDTTQSGPGTFDDFITQAKLQSKANWRTAWTANAVNTYIRAGFSSYAAPVANNDSYSTYKNTQINQSAPGVLANDTVTQGYTLTAVKVTDPGHGTLTLNSNGSFTYTPTAGWSGSDSFTYKDYDGTSYSNNATVTLTVNNHAPVATADSYTTSMNTPLNQSAPGVLANDTDADGDTLTAVKVTDVSHGTLTLNANGSFTYTPTANWSGTDSFTYQAYDGTAYSNTVTVTLTVNGDVLSGLVSRWTFDNSANLGADSVGPNNGTGTNATFTSSAKVGAGAVSFVGTGYESINYSTTLALNSYTVSAWVNISSTPGMYGILGDRFGGNCNFDWKVQSTSIHADMGSGTGWLSTAVDINSTDTGSNGQGGQLTVGTWYLLTYVIDNSAQNCRLFINGDLKKTVSFTGTPLFMGSAETLRIGDSSGSEYMNGTMDDVRIYGRALTNTEVTTVYNATK